jgi:hypothetical protein
VKNTRGPGKIFARKFIAITNADATLADTGEQALGLALEKDPSGFFPLVACGYACLERDSLVQGLFPFPSMPRPLPGWIFSSVAEKVLAIAVLSG